MADKTNINFERLAAHLSGAIEGEERRALDDELRRCGEMQAARAWLASFATDMAALKTALEQELPEVDLAGNVAALAALRAEAEPGIDLSRLADAAMGQAKACDVQDIQDAIGRDPALGAEQEWVRGLAGSLERMARTHGRALPQLDLAGPVMRAIAGAEQPKPPLAFGGPRTARRAKTLSWFGLAAAACLLVAAALALSLLPSGDTLSPERMAAPPPRLQEIHTEVAALGEKAGNISDSLAGRIAPTAGDGAPFEAVPEPETSALTLERVAGAARKWGADPEARLKIRQWATLSADEARAIVDAAQAPAEAVIAAAASLPSDEQAAALYTAVGHLGGRPAAQFALAAARMDTSEPPEAAQKNLHTLRTLDPSNALTYYLQARALLDAGNVQGALEMLAQARQLESATAYGLDAARYNVEALIASGMDPEAARVVSALAAGGEQYDFLCQLGNDLLQYGQYFESANDVAAAEEVYQSVQRLGQQLNSGETLVPERLAGLDMEQAAMALMSNVYTLLGSMEGLQALAAQALDLVRGLESITAFVDSLGSFFASATGSSPVASYADQVLRDGQAPLLDGFQSGAGSVSQMIQAPPTGR